MLFHLQQYNLTVKDKKGKDVHLADTLRAYLQEVNASDPTRELEDLDQQRGLSVREETWLKLKSVAADDPVQQVLRSVILRGCPWSKENAPKACGPTST